MTTQWDTKGYYYPTQVCQYALAHWSKYVMDLNDKKSTNTETLYEDGGAHQVKTFLYIFSMDFFGLGLWWWRKRQGIGDLYEWAELESWDKLAFTQNRIRAGIWTFSNQFRLQTYFQFPIAKYMKHLKLIFYHESEES